MLQIALYKLILTQAFYRYVNVCGMAISPAVATNGVELISLDFSNLDNELVRKRSGWL